MRSIRSFFFTAIVAAVVLCQSSVNAFGQSDILQQVRSGSPFTTKGESVCVEKQPDCQNESIVLRFEPISNKPNNFIAYVDKIVKGQRVPSHIQELKFDQQSWTFTSAPTSNPLYGYWQYRVAATGETFYGLFHILPGNVVARRVKLKVVDPSQMPQAHDRRGFGSLYGLNNTGNTSNDNRRAPTRVEFERDKSRYEREVRQSGRAVGTGANDLWLWVKTRFDLAVVDDLRNSTINVDVDNGVVTLTGTVANAAQRAKAEQIVKTLEGVRGVKNLLKVGASGNTTRRIVSRFKDTT